MEKKEKLGFFKKMFLVITDFRTYPFLVKFEKFSKSFAYLITLVLLVSLILSLNLFFKLDDTVNEIIENYNDVVPEFELSGDTLNVSKKVVAEINSDSYLIIDTDYTYEEFKTTEEYRKLLVYDTVTFINSDKIIIEVDGEPMPSSEINFGMLNYNLDKQSLFDDLNTYSKDISYKIYLGFGIYISIFIAYFITVLFRVLFLACIMSIISIFFGVRLNFANYLKVAIYAYTLPLLIEVIAICMVGTIKDYAYYTTLMLTYIYAIYAIRAIKLDAFIVMLSNKKESKHTFGEFSEELKKYNELANEGEKDIKEDGKEEAKPEEKDEEENNDKK